MRTRRLRRLAAGSLAGLSLAIAARAAERVPLPPQPTGVPYPTERWPEAAPGADVDAQRLAAALESAFAAKGRGGVPDTRALVAVHRGAIVAERYAPGFGPQSRFQSWSMAKSVTQALIGILVREGRVDVNAPRPGRGLARAGGSARRAHFRPAAPHELGPRQRRRRVGNGHLRGEAAVRRGLARRVRVLHGVPLIHPPGEVWDYSTGTSMILAGVVGQTVGGGREGMLAFIHAELFDPLGMRSAVPEFDAAGTFLGGAFVWANARDWARFGLLFLRDGVWDGARVLPAGWVDYVRTPAPASNNGVYGAQLWLNLEPKENQFKPLPGGPASAISVNGNNGQMVVIVPTHDLVVVRLGEMQASTWPSVTGDVAAIVAAFPPRATQE